MPALTSFLPNILSIPDGRPTDRRTTIDTLLRAAARCFLLWACVAPTVDFQIAAAQSGRTDYHAIVNFQFHRPMADILIARYFVATSAEWECEAACGYCPHLDDCARPVVGVYFRPNPPCVAGYCNIFTPGYYDVWCVSHVPGSTDGCDSYNQYCVYMETRCGGKISVMCELGSDCQFVTWNGLPPGLSPNDGEYLDSLNLDSLLKQCNPVVDLYFANNQIVEHYNARTEHQDMRERVILVLKRKLNDPLCIDPPELVELSFDDSYDPAWLSLDNYIDVGGFRYQFNEFERYPAYWYLPGDVTIPPQEYLPLKAYYQEFMAVERVYNTQVGIEGPNSLMRGTEGSYSLRILPVEGPLYPLAFVRKYQGTSSLIRDPDGVHIGKAEVIDGLEWEGKLVENGHVYLDSVYFVNWGSGSEWPYMEGRNVAETGLRLDVEVTPRDWSVQPGTINVDDAFVVDPQIECPALPGKNCDNGTSSGWLFENVLRYELQVPLPEDIEVSVARVSTGPNQGVWYVTPGSGDRGPFEFDLQLRVAPFIANPGRPDLCPTFAFQQCDEPDRQPFPAFASWREHVLELYDDPSGGYLEYLRDLIDNGTLVDPNAEAEAFTGPPEWNTETFEQLVQSVVQVSAQGMWSQFVANATELDLDCESIVGQFTDWPSGIGKLGAFDPNSGNDCRHLVSFVRPSDQVGLLLYAYHHTEPSVEVRVDIDNVDASGNHTSCLENQSITLYQAQDGQQRDLPGVYVYPGPGQIPALPFYGQWCAGPVLEVEPHSLWRLEFTDGFGTVLGEVAVDRRVNYFEIGQLPESMTYADYRPMYGQTLSFRLTPRYPARWMVVCKPSMYEGAAMNWAVPQEEDQYLDAVMVADAGWETPLNDHQDFGQSTMISSEATEDPIEFRVLVLDYAAEMEISVWEIAEDGTRIRSAEFRPPDGGSALESCKLPLGYDQWHDDVDWASDDSDLDGLTRWEEYRGVITATDPFSWRSLDHTRPQMFVTDMGNVLSFSYLSDPWFQNEVIPSVIGGDLILLSSDAAQLAALTDSFETSAGIQYFLDTKQQHYSVADDQWTAVAYAVMPRPLYPLPPGFPNSDIVPRPQQTVIPLRRTGDPEIEYGRVIRTGDAFPGSAGCVEIGVLVNLIDDRVTDWSEHSNLEGNQVQQVREILLQRVLLHELGHALDIDDHVPQTAGNVDGCFLKNPLGTIPNDDDSWAQWITQYANGSGNSAWGFRHDQFSCDTQRRYRP
ncbi:hypothetical protein HZB60_12350 [candidate division KSB1 bacterium]|nr:hypothetical protein [candidate division KSB1 bacterium]